MRLTLSRFADLPTCTLGRIITDDGPSFYTMEPPWQNNAPRVSCIPPGSYTLAWVKSNLTAMITAHRIENAWRLLDVPSRSDIVIHPGNEPDNTQGCILLGQEFSMGQGGPMLKNSIKAIMQLDEYLSRPETHLLTIEWQGRQLGHLKT